jgi:GNAT superfamily N-acetyltransferase
VQEFEIRAARPEDLKSIEAVFKSHKSGDDRKFAKRYYRSYLSKPATHPEDVVLVGLSGEQVAGVIGYLRDRREAQGIFWLGWFYVHKEEQGHSFGKKLLDHVIAEVKKRGTRKLYTDTNSGGPTIGPATETGSLGSRRRRRRFRITMRRVSIR